MLLLYISFLDLSTQCVQALTAAGIHIEKVVLNLEKIMENPVVSKV